MSQAALRGLTILFFTAPLFTLGAVSFWGFGCCFGTSPVALRTTSNAI